MEILTELIKKARAEKIHYQNNEGVRVVLWEKNNQILDICLFMKKDRWSVKQIISYLEKIWDLDNCYNITVEAHFAN